MPPPSTAPGPQADIRALAGSRKQNEVLISAPAIDASSGADPTCGESTEQLTSRGTGQ